MTTLGPLAPWAADPSAGALLCDFDGTLAAIVDDADRARPLPGADALLARLATRLGVVAVVSGRPARFLQEHLPAVGPAVRLVGLYGMQWVADGAVHVAPEVAPWVPAVRAVVDRAVRQAPPDVHVEDKEVTVVLHWRRAPARQQWCEEQAARWAQESGLAVQPARMAVELRPPVPTDKGSAVEVLAAGQRLVAYAGDDVGDLAAFDALDRLQAGGATAARVVVADEETPAALLARADMVVDGPGAFLAVLGRLSDEAGAPGD